MKSPNILLVFPDQLRGDWIEPLAGVPVRTPNVKELARRGVSFARTWTPSPICAPARASLATVTNYDRSPVQHNNQNMPPDGDTFYKHLAQAGYEVVTTGKLDLLKGFMDWGRDGVHATEGGNRLNDLGFSGGIDSAGKHDALRGRERGVAEPYMSHLAGLGLDRIHFEDYLRREPGEVWKPIGETMRNPVPPPASYANTDLSPLPESAYCDNWIGKQAMSELTRLLDGEAPWFLVVNFSGPHEPLDVTKTMRARWKDVPFPQPHQNPHKDDQLHLTMRQNYASMIELIDDWLGRYMQTIEDAGATDDTLIVFASDHGEMLGDCNIWGKSVHFEPSLHVPLIMAGAGCPPAHAARNDPVSLLDMPATFLDFAGCSMPGIDGISLRPAIETGAPHKREFVFSGLGNWRTVSDGSFKLVAGFDEGIVAFETQFQSFDPANIAKAKLYDLAADPWDKRDISSDHPAAHKRLCDALLNDIATSSNDLLSATSI